MFKTKHNSSAGNSFDNWWSVRRCSQTCGLQKNTIAASFKWQVSFLQKSFLEVVRKSPAFGLQRETMRRSEVLELVSSLQNNYIKEGLCR